MQWIKVKGITVRFIHAEYKKVKVGKLCLTSCPKSLFCTRKTSMAKSVFM